MVYKNEKIKVDEEFANVVLSYLQKVYKGKGISRTEVKDYGENGFGILAKLYQEDEAIDLETNE